jgi:predicted RNA-binding Zn-ribbon protein involved in translation (DUF1610 family)
MITSLNIIEKEKCPSCGAPIYLSINHDKESHSKKCDVCDAVLGK